MTDATMLSGRTRGRRASIVLGLLLLACVADGQAQPAPARPAAAPPGGGPAAPVLVSPEVRPDRRVTFRLYAPRASEVGVFFERGDQSMTKGEDGVWQVTLGPMEPGSYRYGFAVDGMSVTDPRNIETERMQVVTRSILHVPGAAFMDTRDVPHGAVGVVTYFSTVLKKFRRLHVYTPPGYESNAERYPVLYLMHGANESDQSWSTIGRAGAILDNLIADGKATPMIVIMPDGHTDQTPPVITGARSPLRAEFTDVPKEFATDIRPLVERRYRVLTDRSHRAIAGLSMGGRQALDIAFANLDQFSAIGVFSSGILGEAVADWEQKHLTVLEHPELRRGLQTIWFSTGTDDFLLNNSRSTVEMLKKHRLPVSFDETAGAHTWVNWRRYLHEFAPLLFR
ncbi:MAG: esterase [Vicinamibacteraceae bacterium]|nr:esterase [Vicinamibacteraceae bacterium]